MHKQVNFSLLLAKNTFDWLIIYLLLEVSNEKLDITEKQADNHCMERILQMESAMVF